MLSALANADQLDLTSPFLNAPFQGALFSSGPNALNVGTGLFGTFVEIGTGTGNQMVARAYNTTVNGVLDNGSSDQFNHEIDYFAVSLVDVNGTLYRQFNLDTNEPNSEQNRLVSITALQIYLGSIANPSVTDPSQLGALIFDIGAGNSILLDDSLNNGSGNGVDMVFLVPNSLFTGSNKYVFLYSEFSSQHGGFEEWSSAPCVSTAEASCTPLITRQETVPEPATLLLSGIGLAGLGWSRRRK